MIDRWIGVTDTFIPHSSCPHAGGLYPPPFQQQQQPAEAPLRDGDDDDDYQEEEEDSDDELLRELEAEDENATSFMEVRMAEMMRRAEEAAELRHLGVGLHTGERQREIG